MNFDDFGSFLIIFEFFCWFSVNTADIVHTHDTLDNVKSVNSVDNVSKNQGKPRKNQEKILAEFNTQNEEKPKENKEKQRKS